MANLEELLVQHFERMLKQDDERPLSEASERSINQGAGLRRKEMTTKERNEHDAARRRRRMQRTRQRQLRQEDVDPGEQRKLNRRMYNALAPIQHLVDEIARMKVNQTSRHLGVIPEDIGADTFDRMVREASRMVTLNRETEKGWSLESIIKAASWLGEHNQPPNVHRESIKDDEQASVCAEWLMKATNKRAIDSIRKWHRDHPRVTSIDALDSVLTNSHGPDEVIARFNADQPAQLVGYRWTRPGQLDWDFVATAVAAAITRRKLDPLVQVLLDDRYLRTDGFFDWANHADKVWHACGLPMNWTTESGRRVFFYSLTKLKRSYIAKTAARNRLAFLPSLIAQVIGRLNDMDVSAIEGTHRDMVRVTQAPSPEVRAKHAARALMDLIPSLN